MGYQDYITKYRKMNILDLFRKKKEPKTEKEVVDEFYKNVNAKLGDSFGPMGRIDSVEIIEPSNQEKE